jgi:hypothetical protein
MMGKCMWGQSPFDLWTQQMLVDTFLPSCSLGHYEQLNCNAMKLQLGIWTLQIWNFGETCKSKQHMVVS